MSLVPNPTLQSVPDHKHPTDLAQLQADLRTLQAQVQALVLTPDSVNGTHIAPDSVGTSEIVTNGVGTLEIADNSVITSKILDGNVTNPKLLDNNIAAIKNIGPRGTPTGTSFFKKMFTDFAAVGFPSATDLTANVTVPGGRRYIIWHKVLVTMNVSAVQTNANAAFGIAIGVNPYEITYHMDDIPGTATYNETVEGWCEWAPGPGTYDVNFVHVSCSLAGATAAHVGTASGSYGRPRYLAIIDIGPT